MNFTDYNSTNLMCCLCTNQIYRAMKERAPLFDDGQAWGEDSEDGIKHNKVLYITINNI